MTASVLLPFADGGCPYRVRNAQYVAAHYGATHPGLDFHVHDGYDSGAEGWSKGAAVNGAARHAEGNVLVLADADSIVEPFVLEQAIDVVERGIAHWAVPFGKVLRLDEPSTERYLAGEGIRRRVLVRKPYRAPTGGGVVVVSRFAFNGVNGMDPRFIGWGGEDISFGLALRTILGRPFRLDGDLVHLWHPPATADLRGSATSELLVDRYKRASYDATEMFDLTREHPGPAIDLAET